jgi:hypothetical protein
VGQPSDPVSIWGLVNFSEFPLWASPKEAHPEPEAQPGAARLQKEAVKRSAVPAKDQSGCEKGTNASNQRFKYTSGLYSGIGKDHSGDPIRRVLPAHSGGLPLPKERISPEIPSPWKNKCAE